MSMVSPYFFFDVHHAYHASTVQYDVLFDFKDCRHFTYCLSVHVCAWWTKCGEAKCCLPALVANISASEGTNFRMRGRVQSLHKQVTRLVQVWPKQASGKFKVEIADLRVFLQNRLQTTWKPEVWQEREAEETLTALQKLSDNYYKNKYYRQAVYARRRQAEESMAKQKQSTFFGRILAYFGQNR